MYNLLIVDDERMIRNGLRDLISWKDLGIERVFTASCTNEAVQILQHNQIDVMLTDIAMPETNGIEMIRQMAPSKTPMRTLILTGYNDFEYARQCCKLDVHDYLLKPIEEDKLMEAVRRQILQLDLFYQKEQTKKVMHRAQEMADAMQLEHSLREVVHGKARINEVAILRQYGYDLYQPRQFALIVPVLKDGPDWVEENEWTILSIKHTCIDMIDVNHAGITFEDHDGKLGIIFFKNEAFDEPYIQMEHIANRLRDEMDTVPTMILGSVVKSFDELPVSYNDALHFLKEEAGARHGNNTFQTKRVEKRMDGFFSNFESIKLYLCANVSDEDSLKTGTLRLEELFYEYNLSLPFLRRCCFEVTAGTYFAYLQLSGDDDHSRLTKILGLIQDADQQTVISLTCDFVFRLSATDNSNANELISQAKAYIKENLSKDLSVSSIASQFYINTNYFSRLFKKTVGQGCNEYITQKRIEKAKTLLESSSLKAGRVAEEVGYKDKNYFSLAFKKATGLSPTAYRVSVQ